MFGMRKAAMTPDEKLIQMTQTPVAPLICSLSVPTIISMLITSIYNMADTFFVGRIGTSATGAVGVAFSLMTIIQAIGFAFGHGSGNYVSRLLGAKNREYAEKVASTGFFSALIFSSCLAVLGLIFLNPLVHLLGATDTIFPYAKSYMRYILIGMPFMATSLVLNNQLRFQGNAMFAMVGIGFGGLLNMVLDPLFIFSLNMGVGGAALATIFSQLVSFCILVVMAGKGSGIPVRIRNFAPSKEMYLQMVRGGIPSLFRQGFGSVATAALNHCAGPYGDAAIAAMSVVTRVMMFAQSVLIGFGQGFQPVCGFNYGAQRYDRVLQAFWFCEKVAIALLAITSIAGIVLAPWVIAIFRDDPEVVALGVRALRWQCGTLIFSAWIVPVSMMLQTIGKSRPASILAIARQGLFFVPAVIFLTWMFGLTGLIISQPVADIISFAIGVPMGLSTLQEMKQQEQILGLNGT